MHNIVIDEKYNQLINELFKTKPSKDNKFLGDFGLNRTKLLLKKLGNPQEKIKIIHIAGTSGKGSTCYIISSLLINHNFKVGLSLSPHIFDIRERFQINNKFIEKEKFIRYIELVNEKIPLIKTELGSEPTYFEILSALTFLIFEEEGVDYGIIETGLGGLLDSTNVIRNQNKISVITKIGLDHTNILGKNLSMIAAQKIGIVNEGSHVFSIEQKKSVLKIFKNYCTEKNAELKIIKKLDSNKIRSNNLIFKNKLLNINNVYLSLNGKHQIENTRLALSVITYLCIRDKFPLNKDSIINTIGKLEFTGRFSIKHIKNKIVIFDGAHNPQKMRSLISTLKEKYPNKKFSFLIGLKSNKDFINLIRLITHISKSITFTNIQNDLRSSLNKIHFIDYNYIQNPKVAIEKLINENNDNIIVVTGSFFLIAKMERYFNNSNNDLRR